MGEVRAAGEDGLDLEDFIAKWSAARGGAERANYQMFLGELCQAIGVPSPDPAGHDTALNDYVFERGVKRRDSEGMASPLRIDLYKRSYVVLEGRWDMLLNIFRCHYKGDAFA